MPSPVRDQTLKTKSRWVSFRGLHDAAGCKGYLVSRNLSYLKRGQRLLCLVSAAARRQCEGNCTNFLVGLDRGRLLHAFLLPLMVAQGALTVHIQTPCNFEMVDLFVAVLGHCMVTTISSSRKQSFRPTHLLHPNSRPQSHTWSLGKVKASTGFMIGHVAS